MSKSVHLINLKILNYGHWLRFWRPSRRQWSDIPLNQRSRNLLQGCLESLAVSQRRGTVCRRPRGVVRAAVYRLGGSDTSDILVEEVLRSWRGSLIWQYQCLYWHVMLQVLKTMMCALVCIGACSGLYLSLYRPVFACIGLVLVNILASLLARIEKKSHVFGQYLHISLFHTKYQRTYQNTYVIHVNTCWYLLALIAIHTNMCTM